MTENILKDFAAIFNTFIEHVKNFGIFKYCGYVLLYLMVIFATGSVIYISTHLEHFFEKYETYVEQKHSDSFNYRMKNSPLVQLNLDNLLYESGAKRCFIIELHNGKYNAAGLSFNYGALTYESDKSGAFPIIEDYADFSLERYPMAFRVYEDGYWCGTVEAMMTIDKHLALKLKANESDFLALSVIYGEKDIIGFLGTTFDEENIPTPIELRRCLSKYCGKLSPLLDGSHAKK